MLFALSKRFRSNWIYILLFFQRNIRAPQPTPERRYRRVITHPMWMNEKKWIFCVCNIDFDRKWTMPMVEVCSRVIAYLAMNTRWKAMKGFFQFILVRKMADIFAVFNRRMYKIAGIFSLKSPATNELRWWKLFKAHCYTQYIHT